MMLITHLVCGVLLGSGAALASLLVGLPIWAALLVGLLGGNVGMMASALATYLFPLPKLPDTLELYPAQA
jgi:hypothetical protein